MYAIYKQNKFGAEYESKHEVILYSRIKFKDFQNYISPWGRISDNVFTKKSQDGRARLSIQYSL